MTTAIDFVSLSIEEEPSEEVLEAIEDVLKSQDRDQMPAVEQYMHERFSYLLDEKGGKTDYPDNKLLEFVGTYYSINRTYYLFGDAVSVCYEQIKHLITQRMSELNADFDNDLNDYIQVAYMVIMEELPEFRAIKRKPNETTGHGFEAYIYRKLGHRFAQERNGGAYNKEQGRTHYLFTMIRDIKNATTAFAMRGITNPSTSDIAAYINNSTGRVRKITETQVINALKREPMTSSLIDEGMTQAHVGNPEQEMLRADLEAKIASLSTDQTLPKKAQILISALMKEIMDADDNDIPDFTQNEIVKRTLEKHGIHMQAAEAGIYLDKIRTNLKRTGYYGGPKGRTASRPKIHSVYEYHTAEEKQMLEDDLLASFSEGM